MNNQKKNKIEMPLTMPYALTKLPILIILLIIVFIVSNFASNYHNVGVWENNTIWEKAIESCGDRPFLFADSTCNQVYSYCASFWFPVYTVWETHCIGADTPHFIWVWEAEMQENPQEDDGNG